jgi:hypothetical protein
MGKMRQGVQAKGEWRFSVQGKKLKVKKICA